MSKLKKSPPYFLLHLCLEGENYSMPGIIDSKRAEFSRLRGSKKSGPHLNDGVNWALSNITITSLDMSPTAFTSTPSATIATIPSSDAILSGVSV